MKILMAERKTIKALEEVHRADPQHLLVQQAEAKYVRSVSLSQISLISVIFR